LAGGLIESWFNFTVIIKDPTLIVYPSPGFSNAGLGF